MYGLAKDLESKGVEVAIDRYVQAGGSLTQFMETSVRESDYVLLVCTPRFAERANGRSGGVGYEAQVVTGSLFHGARIGKFVPLLRSGTSKDALPSYCSSFLAIDFRLEEGYPKALDALVRHLWQEPEYVPGPLGPKPDFAPAPASPRSVPAPPSRTPTTAAGATSGISWVNGQVMFDSMMSDTESTIPLLVHFWAEWCGPCKMVTPVLDEIARENVGLLKVVAVDIDENPGIARDYQIMSIPTMIAMRGGRPVKQIVGAKPKAALLNDLEPLLTAAEEERERARTEEVVALTIHDGRVRLARIKPDGTYSYVDRKDQRHGLLYLRTQATELQTTLVLEFEALVNDSRTTRQDLVAFLERNPEFILGEDYRAAYSRVFLRPADPTTPSFVLEPLAGELCDLLQVEPPQHEIASLVNGVAMLSNVVMEAVARLRAYREYFEEERNRVRIEDEHGIQLFRPRMFVVIGRSRLLDPLSRRRLETSVGDVSLRTWDEVLTRAKARLTGPS